MASVFGVDIYAKLLGPDGKPFPNRLEMGNGTGVGLILPVGKLGVKWLTAQIIASAEVPDAAWLTNAVAELKISNSGTNGSWFSFPGGAVTLSAYGFFATVGGEASLYVGNVAFIGVDVTTAGASQGIKEVWFGADTQR